MIKKVLFFSVCVLILGLFFQVERGFCFNEDEYYIPVPQVAIEKSHKEDSLAGIPSESWSYDINWSWQDVAKHFKNQAPNHGWKEIGTSNMASFMANNTVMFQKNNRRLTITRLPGIEVEEGSLRFMIALIKINALPDSEGNDSIRNRPEGLGEAFNQIQGMDMSGMMSSMFSNKPFSELVSDVPVMPGANQLMSQQRENMTMGVFMSSESAENIEKFYLDKMKAAGWSVEKVDVNDTMGQLKNKFAEGEIAPPADCPTCVDNPNMPKISSDTALKALGMVDMKIIYKYTKSGGKSCMVTVMSMGQAGSNMINIVYTQE